MTHQLKWGLGVLIVLLVGAFSYLIYQEYADIEEIKEDGKAFRDKIAKMDEQRETQEQQAEVPNAEQVQPMSNGDVQITDAPIENSQQHDSVEISDSVEIEARIKALREQQLAEYIAKWGEPPSPDGSYQHFYDNHGDVLRHYRGTSVVSHYRLEVGFAPTISEFERYKQLRAELRAVYKETGKSINIKEVERINDKIQTLVKTAQREVPVPYGFGYYGDSISQGEEKILDDEAVKLFYKRMGVPHLFELYKEGIY